MKPPAKHKLFPIVRDETSVFQTIEKILMTGMNPRFDGYNDPFWIVERFGVFFSAVTSIQGSRWFQDGNQARKNMTTNEWEFTND